MSVVKVIELIGVSEKSFDDAVNNALKEVKKSIRNITGIKVLGWTADVSDGKIQSYKANVKVAFTIER